VSLLPRFARETTHAASYGAMVGQQVLAQGPIADPGSFPRRQSLRTSLAVRSLPRREPPPSLRSGDYSRRELLGDDGPTSSISRSVNGTGSFPRRQDLRSRRAKSPRGEEARAAGAKRLRGVRRAVEAASGRAARRCAGEAQIPRYRGATWAEPLAGAPKAQIPRAREATVQPGLRSSRCGDRPLLSGGLAGAARPGCGCGLAASGLPPR